MEHGPIGYLARVASWCLRRRSPAWLRHTQIREAGCQTRTSRATLFCTRKQLRRRIRFARCSEPKDQSMYEWHARILSSVEWRYSSSGVLAIVGIPAAIKQLVSGSPAVGVPGRSSDRSPSPTSSWGELRPPIVSASSRVTAFLEKRNFAEGAEVKSRPTLSVGARPVRKPISKSKQAQVAQPQATLVNAKLTTDRARTPRRPPPASNLLMMLLSPTSRALKHRYAGAGRPWASKINLDYTEICSSRSMARRLPHRRSPKAMS